MATRTDDYKNNVISK